MVKNKWLKKDALVVTDIVCNKCGKTCKISSDNYNGLIEVEAFGEYNSIYLEDLTKYTFSLCEKCLDKLFKTFKIKVEKEDYTL